MIGFDVTLRRTDGLASQVALASWSAHNLDWISNLVDAGWAVTTESSGGYPNRYKLEASVILDLLRPAYRLSLYARMGIIHDSALTVHDENVAACPSDAVIEVTAWDAS